MTLADGTPLSPALGIGAFAELTLVAAGQCTRGPRVRPEAAGLLGCGVMAGIGAAMHTGDGRPGRQRRGVRVRRRRRGGRRGARLAGATTIVAVDIDDRKLEWATALGATHVVNATREDPVSAVRAATDSFGADVTIEAVGRPEVLEQAFFARDLAGTVVQVGVPTPEMATPGDPDDRVLRTRRRAQALVVRGLPAEPGLPDADRAVPAGPPRPRPFVSETIGIGDVEAAFARMGRGEVLRSVVAMH